MVEEVRVVVFLCALFFVKSQIYLYNTHGGLEIEFFDCVHLQSLDYCRCPKDPKNLTGDNDMQSCEHNSGVRVSFQ